MKTLALMPAIEKVLSAQSDEELELILTENPALLDEQTWKTLHEMETQTAQHGKTETVELQKAIVKINAFKDKSSQLLPTIEPKVEWAIKARRHLALQNRELLDEAIAEAQGEIEIVNFLRAFGEGNISKLDKLAKKLIPKIQLNNPEESLTSELVTLHKQIELERNFLLFPIEQQEKTRELCIQHCQKAIHIAQTLQDKGCQAFYSRILAQVLHNSRQYSEAESVFTQTLKLYQDCAMEEPHVFLKDVAITLQDLGLSQLIQGKLSNAERFFFEALAIYQKLAEIEPHIFLQDVAITFNNLGSVQSEQGKLAEAEESFFESVKIIRKLEKEDPYVVLPDLAMLLNNLGSMLSEQGKLTQAKDSFFEALEIIRKLEETEPYNYLPDIAKTLYNLGNLQIEQKKLKEAEGSFLEALAIYKKLSDTEGTAFNQNIAQILNSLGSLQLEQNNFDEAVKNFESAISLIEDLRAKENTIDDRNRMLQGNNNVYSNLLTCYLKMKEWKKALEIGELGKSRSLSDLLNLKAEDLQPKSPSSATLAIVKNLGMKYSQIIKELQRIESYERHISEQLYQYENSIKQLIDDEMQKVSLQQIAEQKQPLEEEKQRVQNQRFAVQTELKSVLEEINKYDQDFPPKAKDIDAESIFAISKNQNRTIVMFRILNESTVAIFVFPTGELHIKEIKGFGQDDLYDLFYEKWLIPYQQWKKSPNQPRNLKEASFYDSSPETDIIDWLFSIEQTLETIYEKLIIHVHQILKEKSPTKDILFIPSQSLALLPLHAASWNDENGKKHYLLEDFTISYCPSVSVFKRCQENENVRTNKILFVTNPTKDLTSSEKEVEFIKKNYQPCKNLPRGKATKSAVINALTDDYSFIHFSCHGFHNQGNQFESGLKMADGQITLSEIINCNLKNNWLTTLSACETGMVDFASPTDEHFGLPLGFIFAGSPSIWASLWSVHDEKTSMLMKKAYKNLNKKEFRNNKPEALRQAQLSVLKEFPHPYYWAGFQHFGV